MKIQNYKESINISLVTISISHPNTGSVLE